MRASTMALTVLGYLGQPLKPRPRNYDGRSQLRFELRPKTYRIDETRLYQTPMDAEELAAHNERLRWRREAKKNEERRAERLRLAAEFEAEQRAARREKYLERLKQQTRQFAEWERLNEGDE